MKKAVLVLLFVTLRFASQAQPYGNEWINYNQTYYKIQVWADGIYRIPASTLQASIQNLSGINSATFALYHNGQQVPIYISAANLGSGDYIEFFGKKNIGDVDSFLYKSDTMQPHIYYSLFTDTSVYYLTVNSTTTNNLRIVPYTNALPSSIPVETYFWACSRQLYTSANNQGQQYSAQTEYTWKSIFDYGEGYSNGTFFGNSSQTFQVTNQSYSIPTSFIYTGGSDSAYFKTVYENVSPEFHYVVISLNSGTIYQPQPFVGTHINRVSIPLALNQLSNGNTTVTFSTNNSMDASASSEQNSVCYNEFNYPHTFDFGGQNTYSFQIAGDQGTQKHIKITGFNNNGLQPVLFVFDSLNNYIMNYSIPPGNNPEFVLPLSSAKRNLYLVSGGAGSIDTITQLTTLQFTNYGAASSAADYLIIYNKALDLNGGYVTQYRQYRDRNYGGLYHTGLFDIEQLYDQFAYGVRKSPLAIRNFIQFALHQNAIHAWSYKPQYVFIIGKGRLYTNPGPNPAPDPGTRFGGVAWAQCLVPTFGYPGSDNLLAATRPGDVPTVSIGRLAAQNTNSVAVYLSKMKEYETQHDSADYLDNQPIHPKIWQKQILHFGGGTNSEEQRLFRNYLTGYAQIAGGTSWGANVDTFYKDMSTPISTAESQTIQTLIDTGASVLTFFGHSATEAFDFSIDLPQNYINYGKYPVIISNGCFSGDIFEATTGFSEQFVIDSNVNNGKTNVGAIAFLATTDLSVTFGLNNFTSDLYTNFCGPLYNVPLGLSMKQTLTDMFTNPAYSDIFTQLASYEMTLHGDPALKLNQYTLPDYAVDNSSIYFTPSNITQSTDSFHANLIITNLGKAINKNISVTMERDVFDINNNLVTFNYKKIIPAPYYQDTITFTFPTIVGGIGAGQNYFYPYVDADFQVTEMAEGNNGWTRSGGLSPVSITIQSDDILPIYPYEFAIDSDKKVILKASTTNPFAPNRQYDFQIDTTQYYNSGFFRQGSVTQSGGVVHWQPDTTRNQTYFKDSLVYYWRVKIHADTGWHYTSFVYIRGQYGWNQSHYFQYKRDNFLNLTDQDNPPNPRTFEFSSNTNNISVTTGWTRSVSTSGTLNFEQMGWLYNSNQMSTFDMGGCSPGFNPGITFAVIDHVTGLPLYSQYNNNNWGTQYGDFHCGSIPGPRAAFDFATTGTHPAVTGTGAYPPTAISWSAVIANFINLIPPGDYVLIFSDNQVAYTGPGGWDATLVSALQILNFPASSFAAGIKTGPFIFFTQKGNPSITQLYNPSNDASFTIPITDTFNFTGAWYQGQLLSTVIGPARQWNRMQWRRHYITSSTNASDTVDIFGINQAGVPVLLRSTTINDNSISNISATQYPNLQLRWRTEDLVTHTPAQLNYWRVLYQKVPEAAVNPAACFVFQDSAISLSNKHFLLNTVNLGTNIYLKVGIENVTNIKMDSLLVKYSIRDATNSTHVYNQRYGPLPGLDTLYLPFNKPVSSSWLGVDNITIEANPNNDQPEQYHFNNFASVNFSTAGNTMNPLLDVTFDGQHIFDGNIVSAKPDILITLHSTSKYLPLTSSSYLQLYLQTPGQSTPAPLNYNNDTLKFYPAPVNVSAAGSNKCQAEYKPFLSQDGTYELYVKDMDPSGNHSSNESRYTGNVFYDYKISFQVINKPSISNVLNYPNPFTTSTKFIFTLTGSELPQSMMIQIMTIKGVVVKEITEQELGPIHIGQNISQYAWDGRDQYGSLLANGVYFYRVVTRLNNSNMDAMSESYDNYFKKGFGKLVILR